MEICSDVNTSPTDLIKVISLDPVLTGKVMQLVNSAYGRLFFSSRAHAVRPGIV